MTNVVPALLNQCMGLQTGFATPAIGWLQVVKTRPAPITQPSEWELAEAYLAELKARRQRKGFHLVEAPAGDKLPTAV
jgi:hypothetical protein